MTTRTKIPLALKLAYTVFVAVLVPKYWVTYSPWNFLFFCDVALLMTLPALWLESSLLISLPAVGITVPQLLWVADLLTGSRIPGLTSYMYDPKYPLFVRGLSLFHGWLPFLLIWGVWRLGYDRRALIGWTVIGTVILLVCYFLAPAPPAPPGNPNLAVNINYVHGISYEKPQPWMPPLVWLTALLVSFPVVLYLPAHLVFRSLFAKSTAAGSGGETQGAMNPGGAEFFH
ncbi:MAG TPA: hypothetical protein VKA15_10320 [Isosphaeraceae bacterium]|nr:hypothetical protein [Isosphaeraceae bacterium]